MTHHELGRVLAQIAPLAADKKNKSRTLLDELQKNGPDAVADTTDYTFSLKQSRKRQNLDQKFLLATVRKYTKKFQQDIDEEELVDYIFQEQKKAADKADGKTRLHTKNKQKPK